MIPLSAHDTYAHAFKHVQPNQAYVLGECNNIYAERHVEQPAHCNGQMPFLFLKCLSE